MNWVWCGYPMKSQRSKDMAQRITELENSYYIIDARMNKLLDNEMYRLIDEGLYKEFESSHVMSVKDLRREYKHRREQNLKKLSE